MEKQRNRDLRQRVAKTKAGEKGSNLKEVHGAVPLLGKEEKEFAGLVYQAACKEVSLCAGSDRG
jgi:hypothetical protein